MKALINVSNCSRVVFNDQKVLSCCNTGIWLGAIFDAVLLWFHILVTDFLHNLVDIKI